jgi:hypothetical protein
MALTKFNYNSFDVTPVASKAMAFNSSADGLSTVTPGSIALIKELTASSSATLSFVDGASDVVLDDTYPIYMFKFINIHPATDGVDFMFQVSINTGSSYGVAITNTYFRAFNYDGSEGQGLGYLTGEDFAQSTAFINVTEDESAGNGNDEHLTGTFYLFNPSSTTFVKHFITRFNYDTNSSGSFQDQHVAGYVNSTSAVDAIQFKYSSGNIDSGTIKLYGIKDS